MSGWLQSLKRRLRDYNRQRIHRRRQRRNPSYRLWIAAHDSLTPAVRERLTQRLAALRERPTIALIMPVYNTQPAWLQAAIDSVKAQIYPHWELCVADDASTDPAVRKLLEAEASREPRIKLVRRESNGHISAASNAALALVTASWTGLLDHDDTLSEHALLLVAETITHFPDAQVIYSDEDKLDFEGKRFAPHFKCDWNPELLLAQNYLCHFVAYRTESMRREGGFRIGMEGAQDHDLALRCTAGLDARHVVHVPHVLYHWRQHEDSTASNAAAKPYAAVAAQRAVTQHLDRIGHPGRVTADSHGWCHLRFAHDRPEECVTIVIPTRNRLDLLRPCVESVLAKTAWSAYEIVVVDNASDDPACIAWLTDISAEPRVRVLRDERPFNFSALNNLAVREARGDYVALLNNDTEVISPGWLGEMVSWARLPSTGAVGARLWHADMRLQHGGVLLGLGGVAGHAHAGLPASAPGYHGRAHCVQSLSAVTAACLVVAKSRYLQVGGLDEASFAVAFNDVDFCLKLRQAGYRNVWTPEAQLFHQELATRGSDFEARNHRRYLKEAAAMQARWGEALRFDPAYNPNLALDGESFALAALPRVSLETPWFQPTAQRTAGSRTPPPLAG